MNTFKVGVLSILITVPLVAAEEIRDETKQLFEWFSGLGLQDVKDAKWAEVWPGTAREIKNLPVYTTHGFVIEDTNDHFRILKPDLISLCLTKNKEDEKDPKWVGFKEQSFIDKARQDLAELKHPPKYGFNRYGQKLTHRAEVFFTAYVCWRRGENELSQQLYDQAVNLPLEENISNGNAGPYPTMRQLLEFGIGRAATWTALYQLAGHTYGMDKTPFRRDELLEIFRGLVKNYPGSPCYENAVKITAMLENMVREDKERRILTDKEMAKLPEEQRIAELSYRLRDQSGLINGSGRLDIRYAEGGDNSPVQQLLKIGYPAVPKLIESLGDQRYIRSVMFDWDRSSYEMITISDCAMLILENISGEQFRSFTSITDKMTSEAKIAEIRRLPQQWWGEFQKKGEKQMLMDEISAGQKRPEKLITKLKVVSPGDVEDAVLRGAANAKGIEQICAFSRYVERIHTKAATDQLLAWLNGPYELGIRLIAAVILNNENHPSVLPVLIREWRAYVSHENDAFQDTFEELTKLMIANGQTEAMQEVVRDWDRRTGSQRCCIVGDLGQVMGPQVDSPFKNEIKPNTVSKEAKSLAIELLIHALEDKSTSRNSFFYCNSGVASQRICDIALWALHQIEPSQYTFTVNAGWRQMEMDRIAAANNWRAAHGLEALSHANMSGMKLDEKDSLKITTIEIHPPGSLKETDLAGQISALQDTKLAPDTLPKLLTWFASHKCDGLSGIHVDAIREKDLTGVTLVVNLVTGVYPKDGPYVWGVEISSSTGDDGHIADTFQKFYSHPFPHDSKIWDDPIEESAKALNAPPKTRVVIKAVLEGHP